ncbi:Uncharacterized protein FKW44_013501 [Caligus rogercresseyi]|uniref:Uncharacterized protein n=1 Tax=Caligus rogercresseyi TaxID=217165 RepID=A0A7T8GXJ3_CALRO|nr:Uncharacterized protein FKW44_013501 [Caligus rogercresseyi]
MDSDDFNPPEHWERVTARFKVMDIMTQKKYKTTDGAPGTPLPPTSSPSSQPPSWCSVSSAPKSCRHAAPLLRGGPETKLGGILDADDRRGGPRRKRVAAERPYVFQQYSAPCHTSRFAQK